jgi:hypothetical protein
MTKAQEMKLREWIVPYINTEFELNSEPIKLVDLRRYVDEWEHADLSEDGHKHYYVKKNSDGSAPFWDFCDSNLIIGEL